MKYKTLVQISEFLSKFHKITDIKRISDLGILITFDRKISLIFDLNKSNSQIYANLEKSSKSYKAPFDTWLNKRFNAAQILEIKCLENNRILHIKARLNGSYKELISNLYLEFTGRFTNVIITDEDDVIVEALRHFDTPFRSVEVGEKLRHLEPIEIKEKEVEDIENFEDYFKDLALELASKKLTNIKDQKLISLDKKIENIKNTLNSLPSEDEILTKAKDLQNKALAITSNLYKIKDYERDLRLEFNEEIYEFNIKVPASRAADSMFKEAKKLNQKAQNLFLQISNLKEKILFLERLKTAVLSSNNLDEIEALLPKKSAKKNKEKNSDLVENFYLGEFKLSIGKSEKGNVFLLNNSKKDDFWFHIKDRPGSHLIIKTNKQKLSEELIAFASRLCVEFSGHKSGSYYVDYTKRANVKVVNGAFVNYVNYTTVGVKI